MGRGGATRFRHLLPCLASLLAVGALAPTTASAQSNVLLVCQTGCPAGGSYYPTIQSAVDAAGPNDWVLVWPGDYKATPIPVPGSTHHDVAGVSLTTPSVHLRGMDRNQTIVDGTKSGPACSSAAGDQNDAGWNGIEVWKTSGTYIENLTACNFLANGYGAGGNQVWWNGGDGSGQVFSGSYWGNYLTASTSYYKANDANQASYGIFVSNFGDPTDTSSLTNDYASNMNDSAFYVGACQQQCSTTLNNVHAENSAIGYSGTNAGGKLVIENSEWDHNRSGIVPNTLNNDDAPPPQNGACPGTTTPCTLIHDNVVHDNNNPNVPGAGIASATPVGSGIELAAGDYNAVYRNTVYNQGAWGIVVHDYPDTEQPPAVSSCQGGIPPNQSAPFCYFIAQGNQIYDNTLYHNGSFGNPTNGDLASQPAAPNPRNCFYGNTDTQGPLTSDPGSIQMVDGQPCNQPGVGDSGPLSIQLVCASGLAGQCPDTSGVPGAPPADNYPQTTGVTVSMPPAQPSMPNPCQGVPDNTWCSGGQPAPGLTIP